MAETTEEQLTKLLAPEIHKAVKAVYGKDYTKVKPIFLFSKEQDNGSSEDILLAPIMSPVEIYAILRGFLENIETEIARVVDGKESAGETH